MKAISRAIKRLEAEMLSRVDEVLAELFPDQRRPDNMGLSVPIEWERDGETKTHWALIAPDGTFTDASSGKTLSMWQLWRSRRGSSDLVSVVNLCIFLGKDPTAELFPATFEILGENASSEVRSLDQVMIAPEDDISSLIGYEKRFLSEGGSWVIIGPSGIGKSSLTMHLAAHLACGKDWFGIKVRRPLNVLVVQQENDDGDLSEMLSGVVNLLDDDGEGSRLIRHRLAFWRPELQGREFCEQLQRRILDCNTDVVLLDPLLAQIFGDVSSQEVVAGFLRLQLQPVLHKTGALAILVHHTGKPSEAHKGSKQNALDLSYSGLGSSEITNWARAIAILSQAGNDGRTFRFTIAKRRNRSGLRSNHTGQDDVIFLQHASDGIGWTEVAPPPEDPKEPKTGRKTQKKRPLDFSTLASQVIEQAGGPMEKSNLIDALVKIPGVSRTAANEAVREMIGKGTLIVNHTVDRERGGHRIQFFKMANSPGTTS